MKEYHENIIFKYFKYLSNEFSLQVSCHLQFPGETILFPVGTAHAVVSFSIGPIGVNTLLTWGVQVKDNGEVERKNARLAPNRRREGYKEGNGKKRRAPRTTRRKGQRA